MNLPDGERLLITIDRNVGAETFEGLHEGLADMIVASYLTGTLPDANITVEDI